MAEAILVEVKPHITKMKDARSKLQSAVDVAKAVKLWAVGMFP